ncbi:DksA/TraR family C4-type zinc finger protein [Enterobacteriaceae bacterium YMB-R22]|jgi:phage/conjugal plasmid C-4 type zinc finger TraR family protein|uniref:DksA/TraR family C4-type zinc finger protein n=1 Tax=Tenebrionicola larvae TaxID=2815733 RepID=UPI00201372C2|nr:DksA/TraR family C4-type zinc finger protein [Tenebrionicola larvae]MBV4411402.1 DksA/TraR family C4-type zinc finger protein [Tenebrionicola larvae]
MASGWAGDSAVQEQIESTVQDAVDRARGALPQGGESLHYCDECGEPIPQARRAAIPGVRLCIVCQQKADERQKIFSGYNRRGSKDSQLR